MKCFEAENKASGVKTLQEKYDNLIEENKKNVALIAELKEELAELAAAKNPTKGTESKETQTKSEFQDYPCNECVYSASCMEELDWHFENDHDYSEPEESPSPFTCYICQKRNKNKGELMRHRKIQHPETIRTCRFFVQGSCDFPDSVCWFDHTLSDKKIETSSTQTLKEYKCGFCHETFVNKNLFMKHRKRFHNENIQPCRDIQHGSCIYGEELCWFKHGNEIQTAQAEIQECEPTMMSRLFDMMEQFGQRMNNIENQL